MYAVFSLILLLLVHFRLIHFYYYIEIVVDLLVSVVYRCSDVCYPLQRTLQTPLFRTKSSRNPYTDTEHVSKHFTSTCSFLETLFYASFSQYYTSTKHSSIHLHLFQQLLCFHREEFVRSGNFHRLRFVHKTR